MNQGPFDAPHLEVRTRHSILRRAAKIWNPVKLKMMQGGKVTGGTLFSGTDPADVLCNGQCRL